MRLSSSPSDQSCDDRLFAGASSTPEIDAVTGDAAWLRSMLRFEAALARAAAAVGLVDDAAAEQVAAACDPAGFDLADLAADLAAGLARDATPVVALTRRLRERVEPQARQAVHVVATSQDVVDSALMVLARDATEELLREAHIVAGLLAQLAATHRDTPQVGRTLLQHGAPTTFGAACAVRLVAVEEAAARLAAARAGLPVQLGGAVGTLAPIMDGDTADAFVAAVAAALDLAVPIVPWHTTRGRIADLAAAVAVLTGELAAVAQDVVLLSSTDVGEVAVATPGGSSAMPHKRNPAGAVLAVAAAHRVPGLLSTVLAGMPQPLQRSAGFWQAEPVTVVTLLRAAGATARFTRAALDGLTVDVQRMRAAVDALSATAVAATAVTTASVTTASVTTASVTTAVVAAATGITATGGAGTGIAGVLVDRALAVHRSHQEAP